ncbi:hypothetical protein LJC24_00750, partial [Desulfococcaceae bacterium OttesenSCG-928-F15]|nr:hypothetical protein [Desulfococcaceae bacterium OttesenSCG-928-F15]
MQSGVPVIVSDRTSLPEVVGNAGIKLPPRDVEAWREEILQGLEDDSLRKQNIVHCLERAAAFSWEFCAVKTILAYSSMMGV